MRLMNGTCEDAVGGRGRGVYDPPDLIDEVSGMDDGHGYGIGGRVCGRGGT